MSWGPRGGWGHGPAPLKSMESLRMADLSGQGRGRGDPGPLLGALRAPQRHFRSPKLDPAPTTARFSELPTTRFDDIVSLGSAAVGAALSNVPLLETGRFLDLLQMADVCCMASWLTSVVQMLISELKGQSSGIPCTDPRVLP